MIQKLKTRLRTLGKEGLFHIFGSGAFAKIGGLISSVVVIRDLPKAAYGSFVDAYNLFSYLVAFVGLGMHNAVMQYCSEKITDDRRNAIYGYSFQTGMAGNILLTVVILAMAWWKKLAGQDTVAFYLTAMCGLPFLTYLDHYLQIILRVRLENAQYARTNMVYVTVHVGGNIVMTLIWGVPGLITSMYVAHGAAAVRSAVVLGKQGLFREIRNTPERLTRSNRREYLNYALVYALTGFATSVLVLLDVTCLGLVLKDAAILADYKVAATIPSACTFIPSSLTIFFYPKLVRAFSESKEAGRQQFNQLTKVYFAVNGAILAGLLVMAPLIVWIVFGQKYMNTVDLFRILSVNYLAVAMRNLTSHTFAVLKKVKANLVFSILSGVLNVALNLALIPKFGSLGAAYATLTVSCFILALNFVYLRRYLK
jgi:O-antigen/teichoic acid export membrane protein